MIPNHCVFKPAKLIAFVFVCESVWTGFLATAFAMQVESDKFPIPQRWTCSAPLVGPEERADDPSHAQKDPTIVYHDGRWHLFMTVKLKNRSVIEYCSFESWEKAHDSERTLLPLCDSEYFCAPQVFYFAPHKKWYLIYQASMPNVDKKWVAYSTTEDISDPSSWSTAKPILDGGKDDPRVEGGLDYWIICDDSHAYLFFTSLNGKMWRASAKLEDFPSGFDNCEVALKGNFFEASHTYRIKGQDKYLTLLEADGRRYFQAYVADRLDGEWTAIAADAKTPFASWHNIEMTDGVEAWTDNVSHGELVRFSNDQTLTIDPDNLQFLFQGVLDSEKRTVSYSKIKWRLGLLTPSK